VNPYHAGLKKPGFTLCPVLPTCVSCGAEVACHVDGARYEGRRGVVLTGTCASGKTTVAEALVARHGFGAIDGDCVMDAVRHRHGLTRFGYNGPEMVAEIACEVDILLALGYDVVISHVILSADLDVYREILQARGVNYCMVLLRPDIDTALARSRERTCFGSVTPEKWVRYFHDDLAVLERQAYDGRIADDLIVLDNSERAAGDVVDEILRRCGRR